MQIVRVLGFLFSLCIGTAGEAAMPLTQGLVTDAEFDRMIIPRAAIENVVLSPTIFKVVHLDGSATFSMNGPSEMRFAPTSFGAGGVSAVPQDFLGFGLMITASGRPEIVMRYVGLQGASFSYDSLAFTVVNNDLWDGYVRTPDVLGEPFGFTITLQCSGNPCSARVTPSFAVLSPVPEPSVGTLLMVGMLVVAIRLRTKHRAVYRRTIITT